jgi:dUTP pyrophosphatase
MLNVKIKKLSNTAHIPTYGSSQAAGMDLYADLGVDDNGYVKYVHIEPHETVKISTGFAFQPPEGYCALILARSGLSTKQGLAPANKVGLCDEDYRGAYIVALHNHSDKAQIIAHGDRIAQLMFVPYEQANLIVVNELESTDRGDGGFGSSGK